MVVVVVAVEVEEGEAAVAVVVRGTNSGALALSRLEETLRVRVGLVESVEFDGGCWRSSSRVWDGDEEGS